MSPSDVRSGPGGKRLLPKEDSPDGATQDAGARTGDSPTAFSWTDRDGNTWTRLEVVAEVCVVRVGGRLDIGALQSCRAAFDAALARHPSQIVVDLQCTETAQPVTVALLAAARRYLRARGAALTLAAAPTAVLEALQDAHIIALFDVQPTTAIAVSRARAGLARRPPPVRTAPPQPAYP
jgi:anti-anti-sigma regulatory factor